MAYLVIAFFFGLAGGVVGRQGGGSFWIWFVISAVVPFVGLFAALCYWWREKDEPLRRCPGCGKVTKAYDALCLRCGTELSYPEAGELLHTAR